jgi:hypothetical protein
MFGGAIVSLTVACCFTFVTRKTTIKSHSTYFQKQLPKYAGRALRHRNTGMQAELCASEICRPTFAPAKYAGRALRQRNMQADFCATEICRTRLTLIIFSISVDSCVVLRLHFPHKDAHIDYFPLAEKRLMQR